LPETLLMAFIAAPALLGVSAAADLVIVAVHSLCPTRPKMAITAANRTAIGSCWQ